MKISIGAIGAVFLLFQEAAFSQTNNVGIGTLTPDNSAVLELKPPGNDKGFLTPRLTTAQRTAIPTPANGLLVYDTNFDCFFYFTTTSGWISLCQLSGPPGATGPIGPTGLAGTIGINGVTGPTGPTGPGGYCSAATAGYITKFNTPDTVCNSVIFQNVANNDNVGVKTITPAVSFHINTTDAIAIPTGTTAQQPAAPPTGSLRFNTTKGVVEVWNGTCWQNVHTPPIGSTFVQWFGASDPNTLYPCTQWVATDMGNGEFIRSVGGLSNVAAPPLTGVVQAFATEDHTHTASGSVGNSAVLTTSSDGAHNHTGSTGAVNSPAGSTWIPFDDNLVSNTGLSGEFGGNAPSTCGTGWDGRPTAGNFMGQMSDACFGHTHAISSDGAHTHTVPAHGHSLTVTVGNLSTGTGALETRPTNVAVIFWRRTL